MKHEPVLNSPLGKFIKRNTAREALPIPLKSTAYDIDIHSGMAVVRLVRTFRNDEKRPIEATITFPVPFDAAVTKIETKVGDRVLTGKAQAKAAARQTYEDAIDSGKPAVLHEELLRGLHMLSVANVAPGVEIEVAATFVAPLALSGGNGRLRIPVTVGQIYGELPLVESDAILIGGPVEAAEITVRAASGSFFVNGSAPDGCKASVKLDRPVEITVVGLYSDKLAVLSGRASDGRAVAVSFAPASAKDSVLDIDVLLDVSGSMTERVESNPEGNSTKWDAVKSGLKAASGTVLKDSDRAVVWTFANSCIRHGETRGGKLSAFVEALPFISGGTELPGAISKVVASRRETNVLLVTDGKSGLKIDVQAAVATGARFTVVLVGEDSLESSVGYLAAMTGGQMFIAAGADVHHAVSAAVASMRAVGSPVIPVNGVPAALSRTLAGTEIAVEWSKAKKSAPERSGLAAAVGAFAAHLAIQGMTESEAAAFAEAEGLVCHLTSIVLVDDAAEAVDGIPATRKVPLAQPATAVMGLFMAANAGGMSKSLAASPMRSAAGGAMFGSGSPVLYSAVNGIDMKGHRVTADASGRGTWDGGGFLDECSLGQNLPSADMDWADAFQPKQQFLFKDVKLLVGSLSWDLDPDGLAKGSLDGLPTWVSAGLLAISSIGEVAALAKSLGITAVTAAVALLAEAEEKSSRAAARIARAAFSGADKALLEAARRSVGL